MRFLLISVLPTLSKLFRFFYHILLKKPHNYTYLKACHSAKNDYSIFIAKKVATLIHSTAKDRRMRAFSMPRFSASDLIDWNNTAVAFETNYHLMPRTLTSQKKIRFCDVHRYCYSICCQSWWCPLGTAKRTNIGRV